MLQDCTNTGEMLLLVLLVRSTALRYYYKMPDSSTNGWYELGIPRLVQYLCAVSPYAISFARYCVMLVPERRFECLLLRYVITIAQSNDIFSTSEFRRVGPYSKL